MALLLLALVFKISLLLNDGSKLRNPDYFRTMSRGGWKIQTSKWRNRWHISYHEPRPLEKRRHISYHEPRLLENPKNDLFCTMSRDRWKILRITKYDVFCTMSRGCQKIQTSDFMKLLHFLGDTNSLDIMPPLWYHIYVIIFSIFSLW